MKRLLKVLLAAFLLWGAIGAGIDTAAATEAQPWLYAGCRGLLCCLGLAFLVTNGVDDDARR